MPPQKQRKIAVMGSRAVGAPYGPGELPYVTRAGKSTVTIRFVEDHFVEAYNPTIENTFRKVIKYKGEEFLTEIVDTAGQDEFSIFQRQYAVGIHGYVLVYSVTSKSSFEMVKIINDKILNALGSDSVPRVLVGNKKDLIYDRQVATEEGQQLAREWGCSFFETSAKHNENIILGEIQKDATPEEPEDTGPCLLM